MIYRAIKDRDHQYIRLNVEAANDARLSFKAVGIHTYIMSKPDGWEARETDMVLRHTDGLAAVRSGVKELVQHGYMVRVRIVDGQGRVTGWRIDTYESPELNPHFQPNQPIPPHIDEPDCDNRNLDTPDQTERSEPDCDFPLMGFPHVENRNHSNNIDLVINDLSKTTEPDAVASAAQAPPSIPLTAQFRLLREELEKSKNRAAILRKAYAYCFGELDLPEYGRLGAFARQVGGWGMALDLIWNCTARPPNGDILSYLEVAFKAKRNGRNGSQEKTSNVDFSMNSIGAYLEMIRGES